MGGLLAALAFPTDALADAGAYTLSEEELVALFGDYLQDVAVERIPIRDERWQAIAHYAVSSQSGDEFDVFVSASILSSVDHAEQDFRETTTLMQLDNEWTEVGSFRSADATGADEAQEFRVIYKDDRGRRVSNYTRVLRFGRALTLVEAAGNPEADDNGVVDDDRAEGLVRTSALVAGKILYYPPDPAGPLDGFTDFAQDWERRGWMLSLDETGHGEASWRVYKWCTDDPIPPCDQMVGSVIDNGGSGSIVFYRVDGMSAQGVVIGSSDPSGLRLGPVSFSLESYGMAQLRQGDRGIDLCGPDYGRLAPPSVQASAPCGA